SVDADSLVISPGGTGTATVTEDDCGVTGDGTKIVWTNFDLSWRSPADADPDSGTDPWPTLSYRATVSPDAAGAARYVNTVTQSGSSRDGARDEERSYATPTDATITVPGGALSKTTSTPTVAVGDLATYEIEVALPADVNFYDAIIADTLPIGIDPASVELVPGSFECTNADDTACAGAGAVALSSTLAPEIGRAHV